jgi:hypothetical protein
MGGFMVSRAMGDSSPGFLGLRLMGKQILKRVKLYLQAILKYVRKY